MSDSKVHIEIVPEIKSLPSSAFPNKDAQRKYEVAMKRAAEQEKRLNELRKRLAKAIEEEEKATKQAARIKAADAQERTFKELEKVERELKNALAFAAKQIKKDASEFKNTLDQLAKGYSSVIAEVASSTPVTELKRLGDDVSKLRSQLNDLTRNISIMKAGLDLRKKGALPKGISVSDVDLGKSVDKAKRLRGELEGAIRAFIDALDKMGDNIEDSLKRQAKQVEAAAKTLSKIDARIEGPVSARTRSHVGSVLGKGKGEGVIRPKWHKVQGKYISEDIDILDAYKKSAAFEKAAAKEKTRAAKAKKEAAELERRKAEYAAYRNKEASKISIEAAEAGVIAAKEKKSAAAMAKIDAEADLKRNKRAKAPKAHIASLQKKLESANKKVQEAEKELAEALKIRAAAIKAEAAKVKKSTKKSTKKPADKKPADVSTDDVTTRLRAVRDELDRAERELLKAENERAIAARKELDKASKTSRASKTRASTKKAVGKPPEDLFEKLSAAYGETANAEEKLIEAKKAETKAVKAETRKTEQKTKAITKATAKGPAVTKTTPKKPATGGVTLPEADLSKSTPIPPKVKPEAVYMRHLPPEYQKALREKRLKYQRIKSAARRYDRAADLYEEQAASTDDKGRKSELLKSAKQERERAARNDKLAEAIRKEKENLKIAMVAMVREYHKSLASAKATAASDKKTETTAKQAAVEKTKQAEAAKKATQAETAAAQQTTKQVSASEKAAKAKEETAKAAKQQADAAKKAAKAETKKSSATKERKLPNMESFVKKALSMYDEAAKGRIKQSKETAAKAETALAEGHANLGLQLQAKAKAELAEAEKIVEARQQFREKVVKIWKESLRTAGDTAKADEIALKKVAELFKTMEPVKAAAKAPTIEKIAAVRGKGASYSPAEIRAALDALSGPGVGGGAGGTGGAGGAGGTGGGAGAGGPGGPTGTIRRSDVAGLLEQLNKFIDNLRRLDISTLKELPFYRSLAGRHGEEFRKDYPKGLPKEADIEKFYGGFSTATPDKIKALVNALKSLTELSATGGPHAAKAISPLLSQIGELTSVRGGLDVAGGRSERRKFAAGTQRIVFAALKKLVSSVAETTYEIEDDILQAVKKVEQAKKSGDEKKIKSSTAQLVERVRDLIHTIGSLEDMYAAIERSGGTMFDITLERGGKKGTTIKKPVKVIPEAAFRGRSYEKINLEASIRREEAKTGVSLKPARDAIRMAQNFEEIADDSERVQRAFGILFNRLEPGSVEFRKNMLMVIEGLKTLSQRDILDRREVDDLIKVFDKYASVTQSYNLLGKGLPGGGGVIRIPIEFTGAKGGVEGEFFRQIEAAKKRIAKQAGVAKGARIPLIFEIPDASGGVRKMMVEFRKMGDTVDAVAHKVKDLAKIMNTRELFATALRRVAMWGTAAGLTYGAISVFRDAIDTMVSAESGIVSLSKVMSEADIDFKKFTQDVIAFSTTAVTKYAASLKEIYEVMGVFGRQGKTLAETQTLTEAVLLTTNISILDQKDAAEALTATLKQFGMEASNVTHIIDAWNEVANNNAVSVKTLADATKKAGAAAHTVGLDFEQFLGIVTAIGESTRQPGKEIGTSLRFIFQRSLRPETTRELARAGVQTKDLSGNFKGFGVILTELADKWDTLSKAQRLAIAQAMGGARQYNAFLNLMNNYDTAIKATTEAINSQGSAQKENAKYMDSARAKMLQARAAVQQLYVNIGSSLLPVIKSVSEATTTMAKTFSEIPNSVKIAGVALLGLGTIISRVASNLDYVIGYGAVGAGAGAGSLLGAIGGGLIGRAKTPEQIGSLAKQASLTKEARLGKGVADIGGAALLPFGLLSLGKKDAVKAFAEQGAKLKKLVVDVVPKSGGGFAVIKKYVDADVKSISKLNAVVKGFGVQAEGASEAARLGLSSLNSPLLMMVGLFAQLGKGLLGIGISTAAFAAKAVTFFSSSANAAIEYAAAVSKAKVASLGLFSSLLLSSAAVAGIYYLVKAINSYGEAASKTRKQLEEELAGELTKRKDALNLISKEAAALEHLASRRRKLLALEQRKQTPAERVDDIRQGKYKSTLIEQIKYERLRMRAGAVVAKAGPSSVKGIDRFGRVLLDVSKSMIDLSKSAVEAKAAMVALTQTKLASKSAEEANKAFERLTKSIKEYRKILPYVKVKRGFLGDYTDNMSGFSSVSNALIKSSDAFNAKLKEVENTILGFPRQTPLDSFVSLLADTDLVKVFEKELEVVNGVLRRNGKEAATAADRVNELFLRVKGFKGVGATGEVTRENLLSKGVLARSLSEFAKEAKRGGASIAKQQLITFGPEGPFGLTQARVYLDRSGEYVVEGINKFGAKITTTLGEIRRRIKDESSALIFDPSKLLQEFNNSILKVRKGLAGAGAGVIKFSSQLDLGVKFGFNLSGLDRLQKIGPIVQNMVVAAVQANNAYESAITRFVSDSKEVANAGEKIATSMQNYYNSIARVASQKVFFVSLANEIANLGSSVEKAVYDFRKARLSDEIAQQFSTIFTSAAGYSSGLAFNLPKLGSELSPAEQISATNPELAKAVRAATDAVSLVENVIKSSRATTAIDLPKMIEESGAANAKRFFDQADQDRKITAEAIKKYGGDKRFAALSRSQDKTTDAVTSMHKAVVHELRMLRDPGYMAKQAEVTAKTGASAYAHAYSRFIAKIRTSEEGTAKSTARISTSRTSSGGGQLGVDTKDLMARLYREGLSKGFSGDKLAEYIRKGFTEGFKKEVISLIEKLPSGPTQEVTSPTGISGFIGKLYTPLGNLLYDKVQKPIGRIFSKEYGKKYSTADKAQFEVLYKLFAQMSRVTSLPIDVFKKYIEDVRRGPAKSIKYGGGTAEDIDTIRKYNKAIATVVQGLDESFIALSSSIGKEIKVRQELISGIAAAATAARTFSNSVQKALIDVISKAREEAAIGKLRTPIVGAAAGIPSFGGINLGKSAGDLSILERVYKKFPNYVGPIVKQEKVRLSLLQQLPTIYSQLYAGMRKIKELSVGAPPEQRARYERIYQTSSDLFNSLSSEVQKANERMSPFLESLRRMAELESASKSIEALVQSLLMAQDLNFDTTSIDIALGRHPLSPTANVYGQPAGLNKFERQMYELEKKRRTGQIGNEEFYKQRDVIEYNKKEALRQYTQSKENAKLQREVDAARRAMEVLWKAQLSGVGGVGPIIDKLKSELETAGESYESGGKRYFKGVPSLFNVQKRLVEVQRKAKAIDYRQQRAIVMGGVEDLLERVNKQIESQASLIDAVQKEVAGGNIITKLSDLLNAFTSGHKALREAFITSMAGLQKSFSKALGSKEDTSAKLLEATSSAFGRIVDGFDKSVGVFAPAVEAFRKAVQLLVTAAGSISTKDAGTRVLPTKSKDVGEGYFTGGYIRSYGKGGAVRGPAGIDNIDAYLPEGGYVLSRSAVSKIGMPALSELAAGGSRGGSLVPGKVSSGEFIFSKEQVDRLGVGFLRRLNQGKYSTGGKYAFGGIIAKAAAVEREKRKRQNARDVVLPEDAAKSYEQFMSKALAGADVFGKGKPKDLSFARKFYSSLDKGPVRTIDTTARSEAGQRVIAGEGQGYIKVGNRVLALANPNLVSTTYRAQSKVNLLKRAVASGTFTRQQLRQLAYGIVGREANIGLYTDFAPELKPSDREFIRAVGMGISPRKLAVVRRYMQGYNRYAAFSKTKEAKELFRKKRASVEASSEALRVLYNKTVEAAAGPQVRAKILEEARKKGKKERFYWLQAQDLGSLRAARSKLAILGGLAFGLAGRKTPTAEDKSPEASAYRMFAGVASERKELPLTRINVNGVDYVLTTMVNPVDGKTYVVDLRSKGKGHLDRATGKYIPGINIPLEKFRNAKIGGSNVSIRGIIKRSLQESGGFRSKIGLESFEKKGQYFATKKGGVISAYLGEQMASMLRRQREAKEDSNFLLRFAAGPQSKTGKMAERLMPSNPAMMVSRFLAGFVGGGYTLVANKIPRLLGAIREGRLRGAFDEWAEENVSTLLTDLNATPTEDIRKGGPDASGVLYNLFGRWIGALRGRGLGKAPDIARLQQNLANVALGTFLGVKMPSIARGIVSKGPKLFKTGLRVAKIGAGKIKTGAIRAGTFVKRGASGLRRRLSRSVLEETSLPSVGTKSTVADIIRKGHAKDIFRGESPATVADSLTRMGLHGEELPTAARAGKGPLKVFDFVRNALNRRAVGKVFRSEGKGTFGGLTKAEIQKLSLDELLLYTRGGTKIKGLFGLGTRTVSDLRLFRMGGAFGKGRLRSIIDWLRLQWYRIGLRRAALEASAVTQTSGAGIFLRRRRPLSKRGVGAYKHSFEPLSTARSAVDAAKAASVERVPTASSVGKIRLGGRKQLPRKGVGAFTAKPAERVPGHVLGKPYASYTVELGYVPKSSGLRLEYLRAEKEALRRRAAAHESYIAEAQKPYASYEVTPTLPLEYSNFDDMFAAYKFRHGLSSHPYASYEVTLPPKVKYTAAELQYLRAYNAAKRNRDFATRLSQGMIDNPYVSYSVRPVVSSSKGEYLTSMADFKYGRASHPYASYEVIRPPKVKYTEAELKYLRAYNAAKRNRDFATRLSKGMIDRPYAKYRVEPLVKAIDMADLEAQYRFGKLGTIDHPYASYEVIRPPKVKYTEAELKYLRAYNAAKRNRDFATRLSKGMIDRPYAKYRVEPIRSFGTSEADLLEGLQRVRDTYRQTAITKAKSLDDFEALYRFTRGEARHPYAGYEVSPMSSPTTPWSLDEIQKQVERYNLSNRLKGITDKRYRTLVTNPEELTLSITKHTKIPAELIHTEEAMGFMKALKEKGLSDKEAFHIVKDVVRQDVISKYGRVGGKGRKATLPMPDVLNRLENGIYRYVRPGQSGRERLLEMLRTIGFEYSDELVDFMMKAEQKIAQRPKKKPAVPPPPKPKPKPTKDVLDVPFSGSDAEIGRVVRLYLDDIKYAYTKIQVLGDEYQKGMYRPGTPWAGSSAEKVFDMNFGSAYMRDFETYLATTRNIIAMGRKATTLRDVFNIVQNAAEGATKRAAAEKAKKAAAAAAAKERPTLMEEVRPFKRNAPTTKDIGGTDTVVAKVKRKDDKKRYALGGYVRGMGSSKSDSIPAMLSNGEYVIPAEIVKKFGVDFFDSLRNGRTEYALGGLVGLSGTALSGLDSFVSSISSATEKLKDFISIVTTAKTSISVGAGVSAFGTDTAALSRGIMQRPLDDLLLAARGPMQRSMEDALLSRRGAIQRSADEPLLAMRGNMQRSVSDQVQKQLEDDYMAQVEYAHSMAKAESVKGAIPKKAQDEYLAQVEYAHAMAEKESGVTGLASNIDSSGIAAVVDKMNATLSSVNTAIADLGPNLANSIAQSFEKTTVSLSADTISSMQEAIKQGTSDGMAGLAENITSAIKSMGDVTGVGAAIRPGIIESLEGSVDVLKEGIGDITTRLEDTEKTVVDMYKTITDTFEDAKSYIDTKVSTAINTEKTERITELNERLSSVSTEIESSVISRLNPTIQTNSTSISENRHSLFGLQSLVQSILARLGNV